MSATLALGLLLQALALGLIFLAFGRQALRRVGAYLPLAVVAYHGVPEMLIAAGGSSRYRSGIQDPVDDWTVVVGLALLAYSLAYVQVARLAGPGAANVKPGAVEGAQVLQALNWRWLLLLSVPLLAVTSRGGFGQSAAEVGAGYVEAGLTDQFLVLVASLTAISFVASGHRRAAPLAITAVIVVLALTGGRREIVQGALLTLFGLAAVGSAMKVRQVLGVTLIGLVVLTGLNTSREQVGRAEFTTAASAGQRLGYLTQGLLAAASGEPARFESASQPLAERLDGNSFPAHVMQELGAGAEPVGLETVRNDVLLAVPSFVDRSKASSDITERSEKAFLTNRFGYDAAYGGDFLATQFGSMLSYGGPWLLPLLTALMGAVIAAADRFFLVRLTYVRLILALALLSSVATYEAQLEAYPLKLRGAAILILLVMLARRLLPAGRAQAAAPSLAQPPLAGPASAGPDPRGQPRTDLAGGKQVAVRG